MICATKSQAPGGGSIHQSGKRIRETGSYVNDNIAIMTSNNPSQPVGSRTRMTNSSV
jgi:hypothetical protein